MVRVQANQADQDADVDRAWVAVALDLELARREGSRVQRELPNPRQTFSPRP